MNVQLVLKREKSRLGKTLQSQNVENDKRILQAASNLRDGALGKSNTFFLSKIHFGFPIWIF